MENLRKIINVEGKKIFTDKEDRLYTVDSIAVWSNTECEICGQHDFPEVEITITRNDGKKCIVDGSCYHLYQEHNIIDSSASFIISSEMIAKCDN